ncbi:MAG: hypothetical protein OXF93_23190 [Acidobacteria bacterium]|nr:hypothetical protein [Acidobacteriota bacterium]
MGKTSLALLVAAALGRAHAWVDCGGARPRGGRIIEALRRGGVRNPVCVLDGIDDLDKEGTVAAALREVLAPRPGEAFRDRYVDLPFDLSEALFVTASVRYRACCGKG